MHSPAVPRHSHTGTAAPASRTGLTKLQEGADGPCDTRGVRSGQWGVTGRLPCGPHSGVAAAIRLCFLGRDWG